MFCSNCGVALAQQMKYCNYCGAQLVSMKDASETKLYEKRMDSEMEGLFWISVLGIALILGGMVLMKKVQFSDWLIIAYMILSSAAFIAYFALGVWQVRRLAKTSKRAESLIDVAPAETSELDPVKALASHEPLPSVTEHTTRTLEPIPKEQATR